MEQTTSAPAGGLQALLRTAAAGLIIEKGLGAFSSREVARRAGVSHAAPGYHFGDSRGLLTALAIEGFETLHREMADAAAKERDPTQRLIAIGRAYLRVATTFPAHCEVIFREDLIDITDPAYEHAGLRAFGVLESTIRDIAIAHNPKLPIFDAATLCWTAMQGLVQLQPKLDRLSQLQSPGSPSTEDTVARITAIMLKGLLAAGNAPPVKRKGARVKK